MNPEYKLDDTYQLCIQTLVIYKYIYLTIETNDIIALLMTYLIYPK